MSLPPERLLDAAVVVVYLIVTFGLGMFAGRLIKGGNKREEDYFLAGRSIPGWLAGVSVAVTAMNADVGPTYAGMAIGVGIPIAWFYLSRFGLAYTIGALLFAYKWRRLRVSTGPEFFALRFGGSGGGFMRGWTSTYSVAIGMIPWIGAGLLGTHTIFSQVFGYTEGITLMGMAVDGRALTLAVVLPIMLLYVWVSGYGGVLITDLAQTIIIVLANVAAMVLVLRHFGGPSGLGEAIATALPEQGEAALGAFPASGNAVLSPLLVLPWFFVSTFGFGGNMYTEGQRILSCSSARESMKSFIWSGLVLFLMLMTLTLPVLGLLPTRPDLYTAGATAREGSYGLLLREFLPAGVLGLALAAMAAAVMSTIAGHMNYGAQTLLNDVTRQFHPHIGERRGIMLGRLYSFLILAASVVVFYNAKSLIGIAVVLMGLFGSTITFGWGQWWWWRANFWSWLSAMVAGPAIYLLLGVLMPRTAWYQEYLASGPAAGEALGMMQAVLGMALSTLTWITVAFLTRPEREEVLVTFYRRARPMGAWGPIRRAALEADAAASIQPARPMLVPGFAVAILGAAWLSACVTALSQLYVGRWAGGIGLLIAAVVLGIAFKFGFEWYYRRLAEDDPETAEEAGV